MINICAACDDNYAKYAGVLIASILDSAATDDDLAFYILDGGIGSDKKQDILSLKKIKDCSINFIKINNTDFSEYLNVKTHKYITIPTFYRLKLPSLLKNIQKVIYFDCDMVVTSSLSELYNTDLQGCIIAGVRDINKRMLKKNPDYINAGMIIMDIDAMRKENIEQKFLDYTKKYFNKIKTGDQEIINEVLKGRIKIVNDEWNVQSSNFINRSSYTNNPKVIHYTAKLKPWHFGSFSPHKRYWFDFLQLTPWALNEEEKKYWYTKNNIVSILKYIQYRPLFFLRPNYYIAVYYDYIKPLFNKNKK